MTLPASAAERRAAAGRPAGAVDRYLLSARRLAANPPHAAAAVEWRTDGRTPGRFVDLALRTMRVKKGKGSPYSITERRVPELILG